nr:TIM barrel protein [Nocardiopsis mwathae]
MRGIRTAGYGAVALPVHGVREVITPATPPDRAARVGALIAEQGLDLALLSHAADLDRGDDAALRSLRRQVDHCARLGVGLLVDMGCAEPEHADRYIRLMVRGAPYAAAHGVTIAVKPHGGLTRTAADTLALVERVGHEAFRACWDPGNVLHYGGGSPDEGLAELAPYVVAVGARDHPARPGHRTGAADGSMPPAITPGDGVVDFVGLYRTLREHGGFRGPSAVESVTKLGTAELLDAEAARARRNLLDALAGTRPAAPPAREPAARARTSCSRVAGAAREDPIGTARCFDRFLMVELPLPWPAGMGTPVWETPRVPSPLRAALRAATRTTEEQGLTMKTFAAAPDPDYSAPGRIRVLRFDREPGPTAALSRAEYSVPEEQAAALIGALFADDPAALAPFARYRDPDARRDLVVCTHASVDACCGTRGYPLYRALREAHGGGADGVRVWRVSSFGGHRFAPTLVDFPEGRYWGNLTPERMGQLVHRTGHPADLLDLYRGWASLPQAWEQAVERELLRAHGWAWLGRRLDLRPSGRVEDGGSVMRVTAHDPDSGLPYGEALVERAEAQPVLLGCDGTPGEAERHTVTLDLPVSAPAQPTAQGTHS